MADHIPNSGIFSDIDFMDLDQVMVVPDTPDRIPKQPKSIREMSNYNESSLRSSLRDNRAIRDKRNRLFGDSIHSAGIDSHPEGNFGDAAKKQGASSSAVPSSSSRHVSASSVLDDKIFKHKDRHHHNDQERKDERVSHSSFDRMSHHHHHHHLSNMRPVLVKHGDDAMFSPKSKQDDSWSQKMGKVHMHPSSYAGVSTSTENDSNGRIKVKVNHDDRPHGKALSMKGTDNTVSLNTAGVSKSTENNNNGWIKVKVGHDDHAHGNAMSMKGSDYNCLVTPDHNTASSYSRNDNKGKVKVKVDHDRRIYSNAPSVKGNDNGNIYPIGGVHDTEKGPSPSFGAPINANRKRLVRNGCISPNNIAKAKKREDACGIGVENAEGVADSGSSHPIIDVNEVTSKQNDACRAKGKGLMIHDSSRAPINAHRKRLVRNGCISPNNIVKAKKREDACGIGVENAEGVADSGSPHPVIDVNEVTSKQNNACRAKGKGLMIHDSSSMGHASRRTDAGNSTNERNKGKFIEDCIIVTDTSGNSNKNGMRRKNTSLFPSTSSPNNSMPSEVQLCTPSASFRRPRKISGSSEKSTEIICLSSGGKSSTMKPLRDHGDFPERELGSSSARDDFSAEERESISQSDKNSEAREIQLQADEMLARELQEQLYNETPIFDNGERFSSLRGEEQQEDHLHAGFSVGLLDALDSVANPPSLRVPARQPLRVPAPHQSLRARLFRRGSQAQVPRSNLSRLRSQFNRSRGRHNPFSHMDVETRMEFLESLESLEAIYNEDISMVNQLLNSDREFGENDYEMLLALDENNHEHLGASVTQIANLPVSTVNNDNCEICSICLETPVIGDTVRHLPCLHKFHRDCIDPWLRRKRSCPVCKSDV